jgi:DNA-binding NtrC family response regulator
MARILVVDDEPPILKMLTAMLVEAGHEVQSASGARKAIELCQQGGRFDLILSDVVMPEVDGHHLIRQISGLCPRIRVILMSGYDVDCEVCPYMERCKLVSKPFRAEHLLAVVAGILAAPAPVRKPGMRGS